MSVFKKKNIPNFLTIFRILLIPLIIFFMLFNCGLTAYTLKVLDTNDTYAFNWCYIIAGILFIVCSLTDLLDGFLARKFNWVSKFGKLWDPIADKILVNSVLICFAYLNLVPVWIPIIMIGRDVIVDALRITAVQNKIEIAANFYGKLKTFAQMFAIILIFFIFRLTPKINIVWYYGVQNLMMYFALLLSIISGVNYGFNFTKGKLNE